MAEEIAALVDSLLFEGYALYPYTPEATKNATPTPFGIVYPPAYATGSSSTFDHLELRCALRPAGAAVIDAEVRFLAPDGLGHRASPQTIALPPAPVGELEARALERRVTIRGPGGLRVRVRLSVERRGEGTLMVSLRVANETQAPASPDRGSALARSLLSTIPILHVSGGAFVSALELPCGSVNTFPVLAGAGEEVVVGAPIVLPDHPQIAIESRGGLFDSTEIEEALLLHVLALSDAERASIERSDPAVREMIERVAAVTPEEIISLHGRVTVTDPSPRGADTLEPPTPSPELADPSQGEREATVGGVTFRRGARVVLRPGPEADLHARLAEGRTATIERIFLDDGGRTHLGVTIDGDPGQELMRETSRLLFFFPDEVEARP